MAYKASVIKGVPRDSLRHHYPKFDLSVTTTWMMLLYIIVVEIYYVVNTDVTSSPLDEILVVILAIPSLLAVTIQRSIQWPALFFILYACSSVAGIYTAGFEGVPQPWAGILDILLDAKILILVSAFYTLLSNSSRPNQIMHIVCYVVIAAALLNSLFVVRDILSNGQSVFGDPLESRGGFFQPQGFQSNKVRSAALTMLGAVFSWYFFGRRRSLLVFVGAMYLSLLVVLHQSAKEIVSFAVVLVFLAPGRGVKGAKPIVASAIALTMVGVMLFTPVGSIVTNRVDQFVGTAGDDKARTLLLRRSFDIAKDELPLGSGAGTYGSAPSYQLGYSTVYYRYGLAYVWGSSPSNTSFLQDTFWAKIIGQSGLLGSLFYVVFAALLFRFPFLVGPNFDKGRAVPAIGIVVLALITSSASSPFAEDLVGVLLAFFSAFSMLTYRRHLIEFR